jgi:ADP-heptose:LPS heptosyltransferase
MPIFELKTVINNLRTAQTELRSRFSSMPELKKALHLNGIIAKDAVSRITVTAGEKLGDNILLLPLIQNLRREFPSADLYLDERQGEFFCPEGYFKDVKAGMLPAEKEGLQIDIMPDHDLLSLDGENIINLNFFCKNAYGVMPGYKAQTGFPWFLFDGAKTNYEFPKMEFPVESEEVKREFGYYFAGRKLNIAFFVGSSDYEFGRSFHYSRYWGADNYSKLGALLSDKYGEGLNLFLLTGKSDREKGVVDEVYSSIMKSAPQGAVIPVRDAGGLRRMYHMFKQMDLVIGNDTGPTHLAYMSGAKTIALAGLGNDLCKEFFPPLENLLMLSPLKDDSNRIKSLEPKEVFMSASTLLSEGLIGALCLRMLNMCSPLPNVNNVYGHVQEPASKSAISLMA